MTRNDKLGYKPQQLKFAPALESTPSEHVVVVANEEDDGARGGATKEEPLPIVEEYKPPHVVDVTQTKGGDEEGEEAK